MPENHERGPEKRIVIDFADTAELEIETLDVGVANSTISFDISGRIANVPAERLDELAGAKLEPAELHLTVIQEP